MEDINPTEEQALEVEALESIYVGEFELITEEPMWYEVILNADRDNEDDNFIVIKIKVEYPPEYPNVVPRMQFKNLSPKNLTLSEFNQCHTIFRETAEDLIGEQMIFEITEKLREYLMEKNQVFVEKRLKEVEEEKIKEENMGKVFNSETRLDFTPVNKDTFSTWLAKFTAERNKIKEEEKLKRTKDQIEKDNRTTGKHYFLEKQGIKGSNIAFEEDEIDAILDNEKEIEDEEDQAKYFDEDVFVDEDIDDVELD